MFRVRFGFIVLIGAISFADVSAFAASDTVTIHQTKMKYGPRGKNTAIANQCWTKIDTHEYANCLFPNGIHSGNSGIIKVELKTQTTQVSQTLSDK